MKTRDPARTVLVHTRELTPPARNFSTQAMVALVPVAQRLELAAMLLADEAKRLDDRPIAPVTRNDKQLAAMADVIRATSSLRQRFAEFPRAGNVEGVSISYALTGRQDQILKLLLFGLSEKAIAQRLSLSRHTVHEHVKELHRKLVVNSRAELMARCLREAFSSSAGNDASSDAATSSSTTQLCAKSNAS